MIVYLKDLLLIFSRVILVVIYEEVYELYIEKTEYRHVISCPEAFDYVALQDVVEPEEHRYKK